MLNVAIENQNGWNYSAPAPHKTGAGIATPTMTTAHNRAQAVFFYASSTATFRLWWGVQGSRKAGRFR